MKDKQLNIAWMDVMDKWLQYTMVSMKGVRLTGDEVSSDKMFGNFSSILFFFLLFFILFHHLENNSQAQ